MLYSNLFTKSKNQTPKNELTRNAQLLGQAGFVHKTMAGVYSYLPLGLRVLKKIEQIIREEMDAIGGQEILMPALHPSANWKQTGGWDGIDILFKLKSRTGKEYALGQSHEEIITPILKEYVLSYKDLPVAIYHIQNKFRDELRAKSGVLRGREFGMKDLYSLHLNQADFDRYYNIVKRAYLKIFKRCGLVAKSTEASGGSFTDKISYEFMVLTNAGEDDILYCSQCEYCINMDIAKQKENEQCPSCKKAKLKQARASEVGNVFDLGRKYTKAFDLFVLDKDGKKIYPIMGCYGVGTTRLVGVIAEKCNDKQGLIWPDTVAPFAVHLISLGGETEFKKAKKVYESLQKQQIEVLWDDRMDVSAGRKFTEADLIGIPYRLVVSEKTKDKIEFKTRNQPETSLINPEELVKKLRK